MFYLSRQDKQFFYIKCDEEQKILRASVTNEGSDSHWAFSSIGCLCGHSSKLIESKKPSPPKVKSAPAPPPIDNTPITCPNCGSTQISANKKGFGLGKAAVGAVVTGGVGLLGGFIGSGKVEITCLNCGKKWLAGKK